MSDEPVINFNLPKNDTKIIIKVVGVGGGGGNAVKHMYQEGIKDVSFALCNTDKQALADSNIPVRIQLGQKTTEGLGAGNRPERAKEAAQESIEDIKTLFCDGTKMAFITAGMGGGTGTGAAPIIANIAKEMGILTVGIVTIPFLFEGRPKIIQALKGVEEIAKNVDALLVINNERLRDIYSEFTVKNAFGKADDTLSIAAKSIAEMITVQGTVNLDFNDVETTMKGGGVAIMSTGVGEGHDRLSKAINNSLHSPLLNNNNIFNARKVLFNITSSSLHEVKMEEMNEVDEFMKKFDSEVEVIWGLAPDETLGESIQIAILATGFDMKSLPGMDELKREREKENHTTQVEEEERIRKENELISNVYGIDASTGNKKRKPLIIDLENLDNDSLIDAIENSPTYTRTNTELSRLQTFIAVEQPADLYIHTPEEPQPTPETDSGPMITFN